VLELKYSSNNLIALSFMGL